MRWLLAGYCGLALISISVAQDNILVISQTPRFCGMKTGLSLTIFCPYTKKPNQTVTWYKTAEYGGEKKEIKEGNRTKLNMTMNVGGFLQIDDLHMEDQGVYYCKMNNLWGSGTAVQVVRRVARRQTQYRSKMKDVLIVLQSLLLAVCIAAIILRKQKLLEQNDSIYEEPETDHIYEGLAIETCGGGLYEELSVYAQAEGTEAPWE
ncbi:uncharacterized protein cd79b [Morone saxatilis]|uniref:uncharacterized protein cd79b n=1 Tax=Morone saxatilis TaxID=34816 RepID=UPI0015E251C5|nr:uncharacterized protein cd79b [Morone saxatilis]